MDIGTPERYLEATGTSSRAGSRPGRGRPRRAACRRGAEVDAERHASARARSSRAGCRDRRRRRGARLGPARRLLGRRGRHGQRLDPRRRRQCRAPGRRLDDASSAARESSGVADAMIDAVLGMPDHLRDALWRVESARLEPTERRRPDRLRDGRLGDRRRPRRRRARRPPDQAAADRPRLRLPPWAPPDSTSLCSSYSGNTEETLACYAARRGARRAAASSPPPAARSPSRRARTASP